MLYLLAQPKKVLNNLLKTKAKTNSINLAAFINKTPTVRFTLTRSSGSLNKENL